MGFWGNRMSAPVITFQSSFASISPIYCFLLSVAMWFNKWKLYGVETGTVSVTITESDIKLMTGQIHLRGNRNGCWGNCFSRMDENEISQLCWKALRRKLFFLHYSHHKKVLFNSLPCHSYVKILLKFEIKLHMGRWKVLPFKMIKETP